MYSFMELVGGVKFTIYFFGSFSGSFHPYTPTYPLDFNEIYESRKSNQGPYYQGWYAETKHGPQLGRFIKYWLIRRAFEGEINENEKLGTYYRRLEKENGKWTAKDAITPEIVLKQKHYLRYVVNKEGKVDSAYHIYSTLMYRYIYTYNENGVLTNVDNESYETPSEIPDL